MGIAISVGKLTAVNQILRGPSPSFFSVPFPSFLLSYARCRAHVFPICSSKNFNVVSNDDVLATEWRITRLIEVTRLVRRREAFHLKCYVWYMYCICLIYNARTTNDRKISTRDIEVKEIINFIISGLYYKAFVHIFYEQLFTSLKIRCFAPIKYLTRIINWSFCWSLCWLHCTLNTSLINV